MVLFYGAGWPVKAFHSSAFVSETQTRALLSMLLSLEFICFNWMHSEEKMSYSWVFLIPFSLLCQQLRVEELERSCEIKDEWRVGSRGPSAEDRTPPFNLCNLHDSEK